MRAKGTGRRASELPAVIEVYLSIFNDLFTAFMRGGLEFATERTLPSIQQVLRKFPRVFHGFKLELRELNYYVLLENSKRVEEEEMLLGLRMLLRLMYEECGGFLEDVGAVISDKTRAAIMRNYGILRQHGLLEELPGDILGLKGKLREVRLPYGRGFVAVNVPKDAEVLEVKETEPLEDLETVLKAAMKAPIGCPPLVEMVKEGDRVALLIDDHTRKTPTENILPLVLREIEKRTSNVTIVVATGLHRRPTEEEIRAKAGKGRYPVVVHDAGSKDLAPIGRMYVGTELAVNRVVAEADFVLSIGTIEPHPYAGFSGGAKGVLPGAGGREAIVSSHLLNVYPGCAVGMLRGNPMREEIENAGKLAGLKFIVNTVLSPQGKVLGVVCGDPGKAFNRGAELCREAYTVEFSEKADVVIATPGGYPRDSTLYLSLRGLRTAELMLKEKGTVILVARCEEDRETRGNKKSLRELLKGDPRDLISFSLLKKYNLVLVSEIGKEESTVYGVEVYSDPDLALRKVLGRLGLDAKVIVAPDIYMIPKLRISEKVQLDTIMESMEEGISVIDEEGKIRYMNPYLLREFGSKAIGRSCYEVFAGLSKACAACGAGKKIGLHKTESLEVSSNGKTFLATHTPMKTPDGGVMVLEILTDITERKKLHLELKKSEEKYRNLVERMNDCLGVIDSRGMITFANERFAEMLRYRRDELVGREVFSLFNEENKKVLRRELEKRGRGDSSIYEIEFTSKTGKQLPVIISAVPLFDEKGSHIGSFAVVTDISERKRLEQQIREYSEHLEQKVEERTAELKASEKKLKEIMENVPVGINVSTPEGKILDANPAILKMFGYDSKEEFLRLPASALYYDPEDRKRFLELHEKGLVKNFEVRLKRKDGSAFWGSTTSTVQTTEAGAIRFFNVVEDITERRRAEETLKTYAAQLEEANHLKDLFTDIMRHDLLNPIGIIKNLTEFLAEEESLKGLWEEVEVIQRNVRKLEEMIESASKLAKIESMEKIEFQRQDLNAILKKVIESFEPVFKEKGMQVEYSAKGEYPARANLIIEEVFLNLISNAIKYSPEKSRIVVCIEDANDSWRVMVKDHGEGVPDEYKEAIFERFKRADRMGVKGTGLGLAIVKRLVGIHGGKVWVEDNPEGGSIFYVTLPKI